MTAENSDQERTTLEAQFGIRLDDPILVDGIHYTLSRTASLLPQTLGSLVYVVNTTADQRIGFVEIYRPFAGKRMLRSFDYYGRALESGIPTPTAAIHTITKEKANGHA